MARFNRQGEDELGESVANGTVDDMIERGLTAFGRRASGRTVAAVAVALYGGVGLALPIVLNWSLPWLVAANIFGATWAGILILVWLGELVLAQRRRSLVEWTSDLRLLDSTEFEWFVGEVFRRDGWNVEETGKPDEPDGNIDLRLTKGRQLVIVQCKRWESWVVGVDDIRQLGGTLLREGLPGSSGIFVTLSSFSKAAIDEANRLGIILVDGPELYARVEAVRRAEPCPVCSSPMLLDRSRLGWWFRCVRPGCQGKRDLGADPARAVELLTG